MKWIETELRQLGIPDDGFHHVSISDPDAAALMDRFLPPDGTPLSASDLQDRMRRLFQAAAERKRARESGQDVR